MEKEEVKRGSGGGPVIYIRDRPRVVDPEEHKRAGISIRSPVGMICMIKRGSTRLTVGAA
jgi:hypothetical protein